MALEWFGDSIASRADRAAEKALHAGAEHLLDASNRTIPIETGDLERSGVVVAQGKEAAVGYTSIYAARQHEELDWKHDAGRRAKYLELALSEERQQIESAVAQALRSALA